jgi:hypothetical protein
MHGPQKCGHCLSSDHLRLRQNFELIHQQMDIGTGIRLTTQDNILKYFWGQNSRVGKRLSRQLRKVAHRPAFFVPIHSVLCAKALDDQVGRRILSHRSEGLSIETEMQQQPELEAGIRCDDLNFRMGLSEIQSAFETEVRITIQYAKDLVESPLPYDCTLDNATRVRNATMDYLNMSARSKIRCSLLQVLFP